MVTDLIQSQIIRTVPDKPVNNSNIVVKIVPCTKIHLGVKSVPVLSASNNHQNVKTSHRIDCWA